VALYRYHTHQPTLGARVYVADQALVLGHVHLEDDVSIWPFVAARGDVNHIHIGARSNIQDNSVLHVTHDGQYTPGGVPLIIGSDVTVGHGVILHACTIGDASLIGMGAIVLDKAQIGSHCMLGAGSVLSPGKVMSSGTLWLGNPARYVRDLSSAEIDMLHYSARNYVMLKDAFLSGAVSLVA
jgi:carbonic anhydrase/acetyltransferase-like protein (isoleucine patch superfamily)